MTTRVDTIRQEDFPHGALMQFDGDTHVATRFRLWSPDHIPVLYFPDYEGGTTFQMEDCGVASGEDKRAGWSELILPASIAPAGTRYHYGFPREDNPAALDFVPDFASFGLDTDVNGASVVTDLRHPWHDHGWQGVPWHKARILSLHIGTDTREGTFLSLIEQLDDIADRGYTMIEPLNFGAFSGDRGWGFDCVQPMAPHVPYGSLQDLMTLIDACHRRGIGFSTQLIQNHLGKLGNHLQTYAPDFFKDEDGDWGTKINFEHPDVRAFFLQTARLYAGICRSDMFRFDAVHTIDDSSDTHILKELHDDIQRIAHEQRRAIHVTHENQFDRNFAMLGAPSEPHVHARANWADSLAHAAKCAVAGEGMDVAYFRPFFRENGADVNAAKPDPALAVRALAEAIQLGGYNRAYGDPNRKEGLDDVADSIAYDPLNAIVQAETHDQQGNTVDGFSPFEKLLAEDKEYGMARTKNFLALVLLQPSIPMVWNHFGRHAPFPFFHGNEDPAIAEEVVISRQKELMRAGYDPQDIIEKMRAPATEEDSFEIARLYDAEGRMKAPINAEIDRFIRDAFHYRQDYIEPFMDPAHCDAPEPPDIVVLGAYEGLDVTWYRNGTHRLTLNFAGQPLPYPGGTLEPYGHAVHTDVGQPEYAHRPVPGHLQLQYQG